MTARKAVRRRWPLLGACMLVIVVLWGIVAWLGAADRAPPAPASVAQQSSAAAVARGAYLARAGNCIGCHTATGGAPLAGGRGVETPFGVVFASNITPDIDTGIGSWSVDDFWRALHHGRAKDGRLLYPAFPYTSFTQVTREDADALYAFLMSGAAVVRANQPHALRFPYSTQAALAVWRALYFRPGAAAVEPARSAEWQRGRYLVQGLGHCAACHSGRDLLGGTRRDAEYAGALMPGDAWYAPSLSAPSEAGVQGWARDEVVRLLRDGVSAHAAVSGPMAEVVFSSTQFLAQDDVEAMALFLGSIPATRRVAVAVEGAPGDVLARGEKLYAQHCAACHRENGQGVANIYPALAGNRAITLASPNNLVLAIRHGGFPPATAGNPQPFGMPPYGQVLDNDDIAAVATYLRQSWGNWAPAVSALDVLRVR